MMEKSSKVVLSEEEKKAISKGLEKTAGETKGNNTLARFSNEENWYGEKELKELINGQD